MEGELMLSTKTKEHIRRRAALGLPRWGTLLVSLGALAGCVAFTGSQLHVVKITDTHGAQGMAITSAHDIKTLMQQAGIAAPDTEDELEITEDAGLDQIHILRAYTVPVTVDGGVQEVVRHPQNRPQRHPRPHGHRCTPAAAWPCDPRGIPAP